MPKTTNSEKDRKKSKQQWVVVFGLGLIAAVLLTLGYMVVINTKARIAEKRRGDILQKSLDSLRNRSDEDRKFFELIRQLMIAQSEQDRQALIDELRKFKFTAGDTSVSTSGQAAGSTTTITKSGTTITIKPSTTTTTNRPPPTTTPQSATTTTSTTSSTLLTPVTPVTVCVSIPTRTICTK